MANYHLILYSNTSQDRLDSLHLHLLLSMFKLALALIRNTCFGFRQSRIFLRNSKDIRTFSSALCKLRYFIHIKQINMKHGWIFQCCKNQLQIIYSNTDKTNKSISFPFQCGYLFGFLHCNTWMWFEIRELLTLNRSGHRLFNTLNAMVDVLENESKLMKLWSRILLMKLFYSNWKSCMKLKLC